MVHQSRIVGLGCLLRFLYAANFFNSSSHMEPPVIVTCCTTSTCDARLYPPVYLLALCAVLWCLSVGLCVGLVLGCIMCDPWGLVVWDVLVGCCVQIYCRPGYVYTGMSTSTTSTTNVNSAVEQWMDTLSKMMQTIIQQQIAPSTNLTRTNIRLVKVYLYILRVQLQICYLQHMREGHYSPKSLFESVYVIDCLFSSRHRWYCSY